MKKSKAIQLVLISAALASCHKEAPPKRSPKLYLRSDTTAPYSTRAYHYRPLWYYAFRPYGYYNSESKSYQHTGYYNNSLNEFSNIGYNTTRGLVARNGFGGSSKNNYSVSS